MLKRLSMIAGLLILALGAAEAAPKRIIILRHGEKGGPLHLCSVG